MIKYRLKKQDRRESAQYHMKVLFDISVLGHGHVSEKSRTGVFRVIENVAGQLLQHPQCDTMFCSTADLNTVQYALSYLDSNQGFSGARFSRPPFLERRMVISKAREHIFGLLHGNQPVSSLRRLQLRLQLKQLSVAERLYRLLHKEALMDPRHAGADIFHSPFNPLPGQRKPPSFKSMFLTCYDLIPVLFPHYFEQALMDQMTATYNSITPESWVLCISRSTRNDLLNHLGNKINPDRAIVTELAASDTFYQSTDKAYNRHIRQKHLVPDAPYILSLCTLEPRKNIEQVVRAFVELNAQGNLRDLHLVLVGTKGWFFDKIFAEISNSAELKSRIIVTGFVADEDLAAIYSDALFFVYPSFYEGFGLPPLEAMKCGVPVITSNTSSLPEVVGDAGILVSPSNLDELCEAMLSIYKSPSLQQQMQEKSLKRASLFSWERCGNETVHAYKASLAV